MKTDISTHCAKKSMLHVAGESVLVCKAKFTYFKVKNTNKHNLIVFFRDNLKGF